MGLPSLTPDENYLRTYYLTTARTSWSSLASEIGYLAPVLIIAAYSLIKGYHDAMWIAFLYLLCLYYWRVGGNRWSKAFRTLIQKYEDHIADLEGSDGS